MRAGAHAETVAAGSRPHPSSRESERRPGVCAPHPPQALTTRRAGTSATRVFSFPVRRGQQGSISLARPLIARTNVKGQLGLPLSPIAKGRIVMSVTGLGSWDIGARCA
jgi:hypothetical protein